MIRTLFGERHIAEPAIPEGRRVYAIGDIHGRLDLFDDLLDSIHWDQVGRAPIRPEIILLGDLIDRGPESRGVVHRAMAPLGWADLTVLLGNHESALLDALDGDPTMLEMWLVHGGRATLSSWGVPDGIAAGDGPAAIAAMAQAMTPAERDWLARALPSMRIGDYYFVHAGVRPGVALDAQHAFDQLWIRDEFLESPRSHGAVVVHGHSIADAVETRANRIGLDTGAYRTGRLSAMAFEGAARWTLQT